MQVNNPTKRSCRNHKPLARLISIAYRIVQSSRKYSTRFYVGMTNSLIDHFAVPPGRADPLAGTSAHPDNRGPQRDHKPMTTETGSDYKTSDHESTAFEPYEPEPQRFAEVYQTVSGAMQFVDDDDQPGRWITSDNVIEVTR